MQTRILGTPIEGVIGIRREVIFWSLRKKLPSRNTCRILGGLSQYESYPNGLRNDLDGVRPRKWADHTDPRGARAIEPEPRESPLDLLLSQRGHSFPSNVASQGINAGWPPTRRFRQANAGRWRQTGFAVIKGDLLEAGFWPVSLRVCPGHNFRLARHSARVRMAPFASPRQTHVIRNIKTYSTPSPTLCPMMGANKLPDFSRQ